MQEVRSAAQQLVRLEQQVAATQRAVHSLPAQAQALRQAHDLLLQRGSKLPAAQRAAAQACQRLLSGAGGGRQAGEAAAPGASVAAHSEREPAPE